MKITNEKFEIEEILKDIGPFGRYQLYNYIMIAIPICMSAAFTLAYVFTAGDLNYRCMIPECDGTVVPFEYNTSWLEFAVPFVNGVPSQCYRYGYIGVDNQCDSVNFDQQQQQKCDRFVYENDEKTILNEVRIIEKSYF